MTDSEIIDFVNNEVYDDNFKMDWKHEWTNPIDPREDHFYKLTNYYIDEVDPHFLGGFFWGKMKFDRNYTLRQYRGTNIEDVGDLPHTLWVFTDEADSKILCVGSEIGLNAS